MRETGEEDYWTGISRFMACVMVDKHNLKSVLKGPPSHKYDTFTEQHVTLVSGNRIEGSTLVCLCHLYREFIRYWMDVDERTLRRRMMLQDHEVCVKRKERYVWEVHWQGMLFA